MTAWTSIACSQAAAAYPTSLLSSLTYPMPAAEESGPAARVL